MSKKPAKPIVPGCVCMVLPNRDNLFVGQFCTAIQQVPGGIVDKNGTDIGGNWLTDLPPMPELGALRWTVAEKYLMRVDDPDNHKQFIDERNIENLKPKDEKHVADS